MIAIYCFIFLCGATIGSFLNVVILRLPAKKSIVRPGSHCPKCDTPIKPWDNIPILSFLILRGRCRHCKNPISWRYPAIEALTGILMTLVFVRFGFGFVSVVYALFAAALVAVTFIDLDHQIIPDVISYPWIIISLTIPAVLWPLLHSDWWPLSPRESLTGFLVGAAPLAFFALVYYLLTKTEGMGIGDIKLLAWVGALLGWRLVLMTIFVGSVLGTMVTLPLVVLGQKGRKTAIPFGPFLSAGALVAMFIGYDLIDWWLRLGSLLAPQ